MANLASEIQRNSQKGGLFSSHNIEGLMKKSVSDNWAQIEVMNGGDGDAQSSGNSQEIIKAVKLDAIDRILAAIAVKSLGPLEPLSKTQKTNQINSIDTLMCSRLGFSFCNVSEFILDTADSMFGHKRILEQFKHENNFWSSETIHDEVVWLSTTATDFGIQKAKN